MLQRLLTTLCLLSSAISFAQQSTTQYFDKKWLPSPKENAMFYRVFTPSGQLYKVEDYKVDGKLVTTGYSDSISEDISPYRQGKYTYYSPLGKVVKEGRYANGYMEGTWTIYDRSTAVKEAEIKYANGKIISKKTYGDSLKVSSEDYYTHDTETLVTYKYFPTGQLQNKTIEVNNKLQKSTCYTITGKETACDTSTVVQKVYQYVERMPAPKYNMMQYLSENIHYPARAIDKNISGRVQVRFVVMEDGSIDNVYVAKSVSPDIDAEALRVISTMPNWRPGTQNGKLVKVWYTQPISFKLD